MPIQGMIVSVIKKLSMWRQTKSIASVVDLERFIQTTSDCCVIAQKAHDSYENLMQPADRFPRLMILVINLPRSTHRREQMERQLQALELPYQIFDAIDGKSRWDELCSTVDFRAFQRHVGREVLQGEIGCYHSHIAAWRAFLDSQKDVLLILEDDMVLHADFIDALCIALRASAHWDMLKLAKIRAKQPICQGLVGPYRLNAYIGAATGFGAYLINRSTAERLLPNMLPIQAPIDRELEQVHRYDLRHFGLEPFPAHPEDHGESTITGHQFSAVQRWPLSKRWTKYAEQAQNLWARLIYLAGRGRLFPNTNKLTLQDPL